jgi:hypothetical protein
MCEHLIQLETELTERGIPITFRGQAWSRNCREWVYFTCYFDLASVRARLGLAPCVIDHVNDDPKSGEERGFVCSEHHDGIMGRPRASGEYPTVT